MTKEKANSLRADETEGERGKVRAGADTGPDWVYWQQMPHELLWKAVALSCNIEPRRERVADYKYWINPARWGGSEQDHWYRQFHDRLEIATARIDELGVASSNVGDASAAQVKLPEFAAWALSIQWKIPEQLANMAQRASRARTPAGKSESLGAAERGTVQKLIAGFLAQGFSRDEILKPYAIAKEIEIALQSAGVNLSDETIVNWIKQSASLLKPARKESAESR